MGDFSEALETLCADELKHALHDADRLAHMTERLAHSLAFTISLAARGDAARSQKLMTAVESYLYEAASELADLSKRATGQDEDWT